VSKPRLTDDGRKVLAELHRQMPSNDGWMNAVDLQKAVDDVWPIRPTLDSLKRRGLIEWRGSYSQLHDRDWRLTEAGVEAVAS
jgi:DNA-binding PadR family transcriptional regulator